MIRSLTPILIVGAWLCAGSALAHSPYLKPNVFDASGRDHVTVEAAFTDDVFAADVAMRSDVFHIVGPNGDTPISNVVYLRDMAVFEAETPVDGTYRLSSGPRIGRNARMYRSASGDWKMVGEEVGVPPVEAPRVDVQNITVAEAYVTRGAPDRAALSPTGRGLELAPLTHPNAIVAGEDARFRLLFDGRPLSGVAITVYREAGRYGGRSVAAELITDPDGGFTVNAPDPGAYMTLARYRTEAPAGSNPPYRSYTHTLTFIAEGG
ncbi:MAG: DUF4198 domain-containing protein [Caulobacterales bacterium]|nr:DUF4198 domain-containing protein [Caulobacterales bacterium]